MQESLSRLAFYLILSNLFFTSPILAQPREASSGPRSNLEIAAFGTLKTWTASQDPLEGPLGKTVDYETFNHQIRNESNNIGFLWWNPRDIRRIEVDFKDRLPREALQAIRIQYWHNSWPETPPEMPVKEDLEDDPWRGHWLTAATQVTVRGNTAIFTFDPLEDSENDHAHFLPGPVVYRRTLKLRLVFGKKPAAIAQIRAFSMAEEKQDSFRIAFKPPARGAEHVQASLQAFNGGIHRLAGWQWAAGDQAGKDHGWEMNLTGRQKGVVVYATTAEETLPGSNAETVITVRSSRGTFSFAPQDLQDGPIYIPAFQVCISSASEPAPQSMEQLLTGETIRERISHHPEQSYEQAKKEIPPLDPWKDQYGRKIYLPLAADASWQKFALEWGGGVFMDKRLAKLQGRELTRCNWNGNRLSWEFLTGRAPSALTAKDTSGMSVLQNYLPVTELHWQRDGLLYDQEAFATLIEGPLSPRDPVRNEQTPAILMVRLAVTNPSLTAQTTYIQLAGNEALQGLQEHNGVITDQIAGKNYIRCVTSSSEASPLELQRDSTGALRIISRKLLLPPNSKDTFYFYFPFVGDLAEAEQSALKNLDYATERKRIIAYWQDVVTPHQAYDVPEAKFNEMARAVVCHIHISTTKDPKSGLYMVPAASLGYGVYANEAIYQTMLLDRLGDFQTAADYLNTFMELQGSRKLPGTFTGDQKDVFYGVRVDSVHDLTFNGYNMHHGITLWGLAHHYLYSRDKQWLKQAAPHMQRAADWIIDQRSHTQKNNGSDDSWLHAGLLPAGELEDPSDWRFWYATNAYAYLGMKTMADAFRQAGIPRADYYEKQAEAYYQDLRTSIERATELSPVVRLRNNAYVPYVPVRPHQQFRYFGAKKSVYYDRYKRGIYPTLRLSATREVLYGPIVLIKTGLVHSHEPMADWILDDWEDNLTLSTSMQLNTHGWVDDTYWFSRGGMVFQANLQNPVDVYIQRNEPRAAIRDLYNSFVSCLYPDINVQTEEYRMWAHGSGPFYKIPDEARVISQVTNLLVVEHDSALWLGQGIPIHWLTPGEEVRVNGLYTSYGPVSYRIRQGQTIRSIEADIELPAETPSEILLHVRAPFDGPIRAVRLNGKPWTQWNGEEKSVKIPTDVEKIHVNVLF